MKEFVAELLGPSYVPSFPWGGNLFGADPKPTEAQQQCQRYITAIGQGCNRQRTDFIEKRIVAAVLPGKLEVSVSGSGRRTRTSKMTSDNAAAISRALGRLSDRSDLGTSAAGRLRPSRQAGHEGRAASGVAEG